MKQKYLLLALPLLILMACTQEEPQAVFPKSEQPTTVNEHRVPLKEALKRADALLSQIGDPATRSKTRKVKSVDYLTNTLTRSGVIDTTLYLVNYENNGGFALLGADERVRPIYAISDKGRLCMSDTIENKGLAMFVKNTEADIMSSFIGGGIQIDTTVIRPPYIDPTIPEFTFEIRRQTEPVLSLNAQILGYGYPYNIYCPYVGETQTNVGCVAIATAQIMMYNEWPIYIENSVFPWSQVNSTGSVNTERLAYLLRLLGMPQYLNMQYGYPEIYLSSTYHTLTRSTLIQLGYRDPGDTKNFNEEAIINFLEMAENDNPNGGPIYVRGSNSDGGHAWVIDGYLQYDKVQNHVHIPQDILFHCNWGFYGDSNGYYFWSPTETLGGLPNIEDKEQLEDDDIPVVYNNIVYYEPFIPNI